MKKRVPKFCVISFIVLAISLLLYALCLCSAGLSDIVNSTVSVGVRFILSSLTCFIPFSLFEALIILLPMILFSVVFIAVRHGSDTASRIRGALSVLCVISLIFTSYIYTLGIGYHTTPLSEKMSLSDDAPTREELYFVTSSVVDEINALSDRLILGEGETDMPYSTDEMSKKLISAYTSMNEKYNLVSNYPSRVKPVRFSTVMSDLGISGIYSFFTGEANVNVEYPDYRLPNTAAHELAHQRGICRENEANFVAFLVCISSDDDYIRYSGYLCLYEYLSSALYRTDKELYSEVRSRLCDVAISDMRASNEVYNKHKDSVLGRINDRLNDAYLKANGTDGVVSYGYVVRLAVSYYKTEKLR